MTKLKTRNNLCAKEASFTLFEVIIAIAIMSTMLVELIAFQGNVVYFSEYGVNSSRAIWLARRVMSKVEYYAQIKSWNDIKTETDKEVPFEDFPDFAYKLNIATWKLPIFDSFLNDKKESAEDGGGAAQDPAAAGGMGADGIASAAKQQLGDDLLKVANVEVSWAEGARRNSVSLTLLLANQAKVDEQLILLKPDYDNLVKAERAASGNNQQQNPQGQGTGAPGTGPATPGMPGPGGAPVPTGQPPIPTGDPNLPPPGDFE